MKSGGNFSFVDYFFVGLFASIGIKQGQPFAPNARMQKILEEAAAIANASARALCFRPRNRAVYFYPDRHWYSSLAGGSHEFMDNGEQVLDDRIFFHYVATGITPAMARSQVGMRSAYAFSAHDAQARYLDGSKTCTVILPAPTPPRPLQLRNF